MTESLQNLVEGKGDLVHFLRNQQTGPNAYPGVPAEYSNWRNEQTAWAQKAVLFNQSYHMVDLEVSGPDAFAMLNHLGINSFKGFIPDRAKQWVPVTPDGYVIGDVILFYLEENRFNLVGRAPPSSGWNIMPRPASGTSPSNATSAPPSALTRKTASLTAISCKGRTRCRRLRRQWARPRPTSNSSI